MKTEQEIITLWKENNIDRVEFNFSCGGDEMDTTDILIYDNDENEIKNPEIEEYFNDEVFNHVDFYEASDGYYLGENGTVTITLVEDDGDEEPYLSYSKDSEGEYNEPFKEKTQIELTQEEADFIRQNVDSISGDDMVIYLHYQGDVVDENDITTQIEEKIQAFVADFRPKEMYGDYNDQCDFTTNDEDEGNELELVDNNLTIFITKYAYVYKAMD